MVPRDLQDNVDVKLIRVLEQIEQYLAALRDGNGKSAREWLTIQNAADEIQVSRETIKRLVAAGKIQASEITTDEGSGLRRRHRIHRTWLDAYLLANASILQRPSQANPRDRQENIIDFVGD